MSGSVVLEKVKSRSALGLKVLSLSKPRELKPEIPRFGCGPRPVQMLGLGLESKDVRTYPYH